MFLPVIPVCMGWALSSGATIAIHHTGIPYVRTDSGETRSVTNNIAPIPRIGNFSGADLARHRAKLEAILSNLGSLNWTASDTLPIERPATPCQGDDLRHGIPPCVDSAPPEAIRSAGLPASNSAGDLTWKSTPSGRTAILIHELSDSGMRIHLFQTGYQAVNLVPPEGYGSLEDVFLSTDDRVVAFLYSSDLGYYDGDSLIASRPARLVLRSIKGESRGTVILPQQFSALSGIRIPDENTIYLSTDSVVCLYHKSDTSWQHIEIHPGHKVRSIDYWANKNILVVGGDQIVTFVRGLQILHLSRLEDSLVPRSPSGSIFDNAVEVNGVAMTRVGSPPETWCIWTPDGRFQTRWFGNFPFDVIDTRNGHRLKHSELVNKMFRSDLASRFLSGNLEISETDTVGFGNLPFDWRVSVVPTRSPLAFGGDIVLRSRLKDSTVAKVFVNRRLVRIQRIAPNDTLRGVELDHIPTGTRQELEVDLFDRQGRLVADSTQFLSVASLYCGPSLSCQEQFAKETFGYTQSEIFAPAPTIHHLAIGIDRYLDSSWNLSFAASDARALGDILAQKSDTSAILAANYRRILLTSPPERTGGPLPTKDNIHRVLARWGGVDDSKPSDNTNFESKIGRIPPEDVVLITFAGHGVTDSAGNLFLLPFDIPENGDRKPDRWLFDAGISADELATWLAPIRAKEIIVVIDACHSAAGLEKSGFNYAPTTKASLAALARDKQILVLAATQSDDVALESNSIRHGLLSYALFTEGIQQGKADANHDGWIDAIEWLRYPVARVPELSELIAAGKPIGRGFRRVLLESRASRISQIPNLYDFTLGQATEHSASLFALPQRKD